VDVEIKKQVHAIYKYEHNAITEDEMREELGMDPIPDGDREKMFVELITRENARVEASVSNQETGTKETNNKQKNQGGKPAKSKSKDNTNLISIGLIKDSIDNLNDLVDNYIVKCYDDKTEILQTVIFGNIKNCTEEILTIISKDTNSTKRIENKLIKLTTDLTNGINSDLIGIDTFGNPTNIIDIINSRIDLFKDSLVDYLSN
jgi:hypothetical protein